MTLTEGLYVTRLVSQQRLQLLILLISCVKHGHILHGFKGLWARRPHRFLKSHFEAQCVSSSHYCLHSALQEKTVSQKTVRLH